MRLWYSRPIYNVYFRFKTHSTALILQAQMFLSESRSNDLHIFAYLTHTHKWGYSVRGYKVSLNETTNRNEIKEICKGSPQWPQQFYPMSKEAILSDGDGLMARCSYNTMDSPNDIIMGKTRYLN